MRYSLRTLIALLRPEWRDDWTFREQVGFWAACLATMASIIVVLEFVGRLVGAGFRPFGQRDVLWLVLAVGLALRWWSETGQSRQPPRAGG